MPHYIKHINPSAGLMSNKWSHYREGTVVLRGTSSHLTPYKCTRLSCDRSGIGGCGEPSPHLWSQLYLGFELWPMPRSVGARELKLGAVHGKLGLALLWCEHVIHTSSCVGGWGAGSVLGMQSDPWSSLANLAYLGSSWTAGDPVLKTILRMGTGACPQAW